MKWFGVLVLLSVGCAAPQAQDHTTVEYITPGTCYPDIKHLIQVHAIDGHKTIVVGPACEPVR